MIVFHVICKYAFEVIAKVWWVCCDKKMMPGAQIAKRLPGRIPGSEKLLIYIQLPEKMFAKRVDFIALHLLAHRFENR